MAGGSYGILHFRLLKAFSLRLAEGAQRSTEVMGRRPSDPSKPKLCPTLRPTREQFEKPFPEYVEAVFKKHPDWPCFKVGA